MKFIVQQKDFVKALNLFKNCISSDINKITSGIFMWICENSLVLKGTDEKSYLQTFINIENNNYEKRVIVKYDVLKDLINKFDNVPLTVKITKKYMVIKSTNKQFKIPVYLKVDEFPEKPQVYEGPEFYINESLLKNIIDREASILTKKALVPQLDAMFVNIDKDKNIDFVTTDTYRLYIYNYYPDKINYFRSKSAIVPLESLKCLKDILENNKNNQIRIRVNDTHMLFNKNRFTIISNLINGTYPKYKYIIPEKYCGKLTVNTKILKETLERIDIVAKFNEFRTCTWKISKNNLKIFAGGRGIEIIPCKSTFKSMKLKFEIKLLKEYLQESNAKEFSIHIAKKQDPVVWKENNLSYIIMPTDL